MTNWTFKPALLLMSGRMLGFAVTFFIPVVLVRIFDPAEFGTYKQLFLIFSTLYLTAQLGMAESLFYFLPLASEKAGRYVVNSVVTLASAGLLCLALLHLAEGRISHWLNNERLPDYMSPIGIYLFLMLLSTVLEITLISRRLYGRAAICFAFSDLVRAVLLIFPVLMSADLKWLLWGAVIFAFLRLVATLLWLKRELQTGLRLDTELLRHQLAYALPFQMAVLMEILQSNFHHYAVSYYFEPAVFAIYAVGCLQIPLADFAGSSAGNVLMVGLREAVPSGETQSVLAIWHDTTRKLALLFFPLVALLLVCAQELIVFLFTASYLPSVPVFRVWVLLILLSVGQTDAVLRAHAQTRFLFVLYALKFAIIAALIHWFISVFGLIGAVLITLLASLTAKLLAVARLKTLMRADLKDLLPWRSLLEISTVAIAAGLAAWLVKSALSLSPMTQLAITGLSYTGSYLAFLVIGGVLSDAEKLSLRGGLARASSLLLKSRAKELKV